MTTEDIDYFDSNDKMVPPALAEQYAVKVVRTVRDGPRILKRTTFTSDILKPPMPLDDLEDE